MQSKLYDTLASIGDIGEAFAAGRERARARKIEEENRAFIRKQRLQAEALTQRKLLQDMAPGMIEAGQHDALATDYNANQAALKAAGLPSAAPVVGGMRELDVDAALGGRPEPVTLQPFEASQKFGINMPAAAGLDATLARPLDAGPMKIKVPTGFNNPQSEAAMLGGLGIEAPKPQSFDLAPGHSRYTVGPDGTPELSVTAPSIERTTAPRLVKTWDPAVGGYRMVPASENTIIMPEPSKPRTGESVDPLVTEKRIYDLAEKRWNRPYPVDREGGGRKKDQPDGIADNYPGVPLTQATESWHQGVETIAESLRKNGASSLGGPQPPRPSGQPRREGATEDGRMDPFQASALPGTGGTARWAPVIETAAARHGVQPQLVQAVMAKESGGNPRATNPTSGAAGLMQFMPATARGRGIDPYDPEQAIDAGAAMLAGLVKQYGSVPVALAAYNAGGGRVAEYGGKIPPFPETIDYVATITRQLGMEFDPSWVAPRHDGKPIQWPKSVRPREQVAAAREPAQVARIISNNGGSREGGAAPMSPRLAAFYEKHGITPGGANA